MIKRKIGAQQNDRNKERIWFVEIVLKCFQNFFAFSSFPEDVIKCFCEGKRLGEQNFERINQSE